MKHLVALLFGILFSLPAHSNTAFDKFADRMRDLHMFNRGEVLELLKSTPPNQEILDKFHRPATSMPFDRFEALIANERRIVNGVKFMEEHRELLSRAEAEFGVPAHVITAIIGVETNYGGNLGQHTALEALVTLGFYAKRRQEYFRSELEALLVIARAEEWDLKTTVSSYAGAIGICQFMPSNIAKLGSDFDNDGKVNLNEKADAIGSVANYLSKNGWRPGAPIATQVKLKPQQNTFVLRTLPGPDPRRFRVEQNYRAIKRYNPSDSYAMTVFILSEKIKERAQAN